jgi:hypothetical protein
MDSLEEMTVMIATHRDRRVLQPHLAKGVALESRFLY